jgi:NAD(P)-dependent dehydrogenase (short-subunit alcohol dehydrogenase family)
MLSADTAPSELNRRERERVRNRLPLGRIGKPEDVASLIAYLLSDQARNMTGSIIATDGGWTAG